MWKRIVGLAGFWLCLVGTASAWEPQDYVPERRGMMYQDSFGWMAAPTPIAIEGIGQSMTFTGLASNFYQSTDAMVVQSAPGGDFDLLVYLVDQLPLFTDKLWLSTGHFDGEIPFKSFNRGIDSDPELYIQPQAHSWGNFAKLKLRLWDGRIEGFYQLGDFKSQLTKVFDADGNEFASIDNSVRSSQGKNYGLILDLTDHRLDPRKGYRMGVRIDDPQVTNPDSSDYFVTSWNYTGYIPMFNGDTLVLNAFRSHASVTRSGITDMDQLRAKYGLSCDPASPYYQACYAAETAQVSEQRDANLWGTANPLGGTNQMRAYPQSRFRAGNAMFQGVEYRLNFSDEEKPINFWVLGGIRTIFQFAFFAERGTVSDRVDELNSNMKSSIGAGLRAVISGLVYRFDVAVGEEGTATTVFIDYPWELNPISN
ncbi:MAG: hypothetical protein RRB13_07590 [bacterium]|nr:hypothetical protein [bacterium]